MAIIEKQEEYFAQIGNLFDAWKARKSIRISGDDLPRKGFNEDGIVNIDQWLTLPQEKRILFVLKETNSEEQTDWSLTNLLREGDESKNRMWKRAAEWTSGILSTNKEKAGDAYRKFEGDEAKKFTQNIAVLNLKKSPGGGSAKQEEIEAYVKADIDLILKEIAIIDPSIVIFGGTYEQFRVACKEPMPAIDENSRCCYYNLAKRERLLIKYGLLSLGVSRFRISRNLIGETFTRTGAHGFRDERM